MAGLVSGAMAPQQAAPMEEAPAAAAPQEAQGAAPADDYQAPAGVEQPGSQLKNPELNKIETGVEEKLASENRKMYMSIVLAAMQLGFSKQSHDKLVQGLNASPDVLKNISLICAGMMGMIFQQVQPDPNQFLPSAIPASVTMMCQVMEYAEQTGMAKFDSAAIAKCTAMTTEAVLAKFGVNKAKIQEAAAAQGGQPPAQGAPAAAPQQGA